MIIAVPANSQDITSHIAHRFSRARYFLFYNTQDGMCRHVENPPVEWAGGDAVAAMVENKADVVIAEQIGGYVLERLRRSGIQVVHGKTGVIFDLITEYLK